MHCRFCAPLLCVASRHTLLIKLTRSGKSLSCAHHRRGTAHKICTCRTAGRYVYATPAARPVRTFYYSYTYIHTYIHTYVYMLTLRVYYYTHPVECTCKCIYVPYVLVVMYLNLIIATLHERAINIMCLGAAGKTKM